MDYLLAFVVGLVTATSLLIITIESEIRIDIQDFYRFCLAKEIALEECVIPKKPAEKKEEVE